MKAKWRYQNIKLPDDLFIDWIADDPGNEAYKNEVQALFTFVSESNKNVPVTSGRVFAHRIDTDIHDVLTYQEVESQLDDAARICNYLQYYTVEEISQQLGYSKSYIENFLSISDVKQLRGKVKADLRPYFDEWYGGSFYYKEVRLNDSDGRTTVSVPKNTKVHITFLSDDGSYSTYTLTTDDGYVQGPFTLSVEE
jgi:hypothetical protein